MMRCSCLSHTYCLLRMRQAASPRRPVLPTPAHVQASDVLVSRDLNGHESRARESRGDGGWRATEGEEEAGRCLTASDSTRKASSESCSWWSAGVVTQSGLRRFLAEKNPSGSSSYSSPS
eukprot:762718-Hanusia_phi.AAC.1